MGNEVLDDFADVSAWKPVASGEASLVLSADTIDGVAALRLDFDFKGGGGFVVARRELSRPMPESYALDLAVRGAAPANRLEIKLADPSGRNVWWRHWDAFAFPPATERLRILSREVEFAWGPAGGGAMTQLGALEIAIAAGPGGRGTVWIADLRLEDRTYRARPQVRASSAAAGHEAERALAGDAGGWRAAPGDPHPWLEIDFQEEREYGGLIVTWPSGAAPRAFTVATGNDGSHWTPVHRAEAGDALRSYLYLPGTSARFLRFALEAAPGRACGIEAIAVQPFEFSRSLDAFFEHVARDQPRGHHPRWLAGEQSYWTCAGVADGESCAIVNEEGLVEVDRGTWSLEPFLYAGGRLITWADAEISQQLEDDWMPVPTVVWRAGDLALAITAYATRRAGRAVLFVRYRLDNLAAQARAVRLCVALRPFQVNPPWQSFGALGGTRRIERIAWDGAAVRLDDGRLAVPLEAPSAFGAAAFEHGEIPSFLARGALPGRDAVEDAFGHASGALAFDAELAPGGRRELTIAVPFGAGADPAAVAGARGEEELARARDDWRTRLGAVRFALPAAARARGDSARTAAAQVLVNRDGPALQPGPRRYTRAWIRDGATMAAALLRFGRCDEAIEFVRWYAGFQREDGFVPCCVDRNGPDWLVEHDSHGELVFAVMECFRFGRDRAFLAEMAPAVRRAIAYLDALRAQRLTAEYDRPELRARRGLLPESASHEGYLAHPVHAYWDDFWALQGYRDAAEMAAILGDEAEARRYRAGHDQLAAAVRASIRRVIEERRLAYVPGSVEWADFDPTATAVAVSLLGALEDLPLDVLGRGFDEYMAGFRRRRQGEIDWNNYSAYEVRIVGALVHLGRRDDAAELLDFLLSDRRPPAWNQWPEISWRNPRSPGHIGDVPHTWIGAEYALSFRTLLAYERRADAALVLFAGVPASWLEGGAEVGASGLPTYHGRLDLSLRRGGGDEWIVTLGGDLTPPPGGLVLQPPLPAPLRAVEIDGAAAGAFERDRVTVRSLPARVVLRT